MDTRVTLNKIITQGGSSYIIEGIVNYNTKDLKRGQVVIIKHCMGFLGHYACSLFRKEADVLKDLRKNLIEPGICNNFPIYYDYNTDCLFGDITTLTQIVSLRCLAPPDKCDLSLSKIPDILFQYANDPSLSLELYPRLREVYEADYLLKIRDQLIIPNYSLLSILNSSNTFDTYNIQEFLIDELEAQCSPNIMMSKINGFDLSSDLLFMLDDGLIFDILYTNACLIRYNGNVFRDNNLSNIMIETYPQLRIYKIKERNYLFKEPHRSVIIDCQVTGPATSTRDLLGTAISRISNNKLITAINNKNTIDDVLNIVLPEYYAQSLITDDYVKEIMVAYPELKVWSYQ